MGEQLFDFSGLVWRLKIAAIAIGVVVPLVITALLYLRERAQQRDYDVSVGLWRH